MIEPTDEMVAAFEREGTDGDGNIVDTRAGLAAAMRDRCMEARGHARHPLAKRDEPLPLSVGRIQSYCGRVERPHAGHVWITSPGRWCAGDEVRP